ncbi:MAG: DsrE family protein [Candidatus Nezhaarchaeota archaeon]|nr:DsrE family protein [Candidatus Nezhaarchaeota archaeon]MCX8141574.1 DsrE family protein [Candidatus Nezhaarchaeota archaeon]MDW8049841.1 DsrE family protein [Nitrososphaerota archaeon]
MILGILLNTGPYSFEYTDLVVKIAREAVKKGHKVKLYLYVDGVYNALKSINPPLPEERNIAALLKELLNLGVDIKVCPVCAEYRGVKDDKNLVNGVSYEGLGYFGELAADCDKLLVFTH